MLQFLLNHIFGIRPEPKPEPKPEPSPLRSRTTPEALFALNRLRARPLRWDHRLAAACLDHAADMASRGFYGHYGSDGSSFAERARRRTRVVTPLYECIGWGCPDAECIVDGWSKSAAGHKYALVDPEARVVGVAVAYTSGGEPYWTLLTGR